MVWFGWAMAAMILMGLGNQGMKAASHRGLSPAGVLFWVVVGEAPLAFLLFREQLQPTKLVGLAATLSGLWLMAR